MLDELRTAYQKPEDVLGETGLLPQLTKARIERGLQGERTQQLGYETSAPEGRHSGNARNSRTRKTLKSKHGALPIDGPRDRHAEFEPQFIAKHPTRFDGFDDKIISRYARGLTVREIQAHLQAIYGVAVSPERIATVTDGVLEAVTAWQHRPLDAVYAVVSLDARMVPVRTGGRVSKRASYLAVGLTLAGYKDVLGLWAAESEDAKFWLHVITDLKNRGVQDILLACVDGLHGFPEVMAAVFP